MTVRETLGPRAGDVYDRLDQILNSEDGLIVLMDRTGTTAYCHGFGASGCQLELLWHQVDMALRSLINGPAAPPSRAAATEAEG